MQLFDFLTRVIDDGIAAAKADYNTPEQAHKLEGAIAGFEACRGLLPHQLGELLIESRRNQMAAYDGEIKAYWRLTCFAAEVEWVCNCVSAILENEGEEPIIPVTARGMMKANEVLRSVAV